MRCRLVPFRYFFRARIEKSAYNPVRFKFREGKERTHGRCVCRQFLIIGMPSPIDIVAAVLDERYIADALRALKRVNKRGAAAPEADLDGHFHIMLAQGL